MATLISDAFTRADGDSLGSDWTEVLGDWDIVSNKVASQTASTANLAYWSGTFNTASADYDVSGDCLKSGDVGSSGIIGRYQDSSNYYRLYVSTFLQQLVLEKKVAGVNTTLGTYSAGQSNDTTFVLKLSFVGTAIKGYQDGVQRISVTDSAFSAIGKPGIYADDDGATVDNFLVEGTSGSFSPSISPSTSPSVSVSVSPSISPSKSPSRSPSVSPSASPSIGGASVSPSISPSVSRSQSPSTSISPSISPSVSPSVSFSISQSVSPSASPSVGGSSTSPSQSPSASVSPSASPSISIPIKPRSSRLVNIKPRVKIK